jgi:uncharacterized repeat protein (TIGR02543 family)
MSYRLTEAERKHIAVTEETRFFIDKNEGPDPINRPEESYLQITLTDDDKLTKVIDLPKYEILYSDQFRQFIMRDSTFLTFTKIDELGWRYGVEEVKDDDGYNIGFDFRNNISNEIESVIRYSPLGSTTVKELKVDGQSLFKHRVKIESTLRVDNRVTFKSTLDVEGATTLNETIINNSFTSNHSAFIENELQLFGFKVQNPSDIPNIDLTAKYILEYDPSHPERGLYWSKQLASFTVTFIDHDWVTVLFTESVLEGGTIKKPDDPDCDGHTFIGWFDEPQEGNKFEGWDEPITRSFTLYAVCDTNRYDVIFDVDGGSHIDIQSVTHGQKATKPATDPTKDKHTFEGWFTDNTHSTEFDFNTIITGPITIFAKWEAVIVADNKMYFGSWLPEESAFNGTVFSIGDGVYSPQNIEKLLNGEETTSKIWPDWDYLVYGGNENYEYDASSKPLGMLHQNWSRDAGRGDIPFNNVAGFLFIITPKELGKPTIINPANIPETWNENEIKINGKDYFIYNFGQTANNVSSFAYKIEY